MLLCFLPPTGGLFAAIFFAKNLPLASAPMSALLLTTSLVGPVGLFLAFRAIVLEKRRMGTRIMLVFAALAAWTAFGNAVFVLFAANPIGQVRALVMLALLPAVGTAHLSLIAIRGQSERVPA